MRLVGDGEKAPARKLSVSEAAATGDQRALLVSMRDRIAVAVADPKCPPRDLASLTKRLDDIAEKLKALEVQEAEDADNDRPAVDEAWDSEAL